jgi:hypothetical protein
MAFVANVFLKMDVVARLWIFDGDLPRLYVTTSWIDNIRVNVQNVYSVLRSQHHQETRTVSQSAATCKAENHLRR